MASRDEKVLEMGRSSADAEVRPNVRLGNMWLFGGTSANIRLHLWLRICALHWSK